MDAPLKLDEPYEVCTVYEFHSLEYEGAAMEMVLRQPVPAGPWGPVAPVDPTGPWGPSSPFGP